MRRRTALLNAVSGLLAAAVIGACDSTSDPIVPGSLLPGVGSQQTAVVGSALPIVPVVTVKDTKGHAMKGATVTFSVTAGGGTVVGGSTISGVDGTAKPTSWTLGTTAGVNTLSAQVDGVQTPVVFTATGIAAAPATVSVSVGSGQRATVASALPLLPTALVKDQYGNPVSGANVTFAIASGGGSVTGATATTDAQGLAHPTGWTLGTVAGVNTLTASVAGVSPAIFLATGVAGAPSALTLAVQVKPAVVATTMATSPAVVVRDAYGNGVGGVPVTFAVASGGGTITGATSTSDSLGVAAVGSWTLGTAFGPQSLTASANGLAPLTIAVNALSAPASQVAIYSGNNQSVGAGGNVSVAPSVVVRDRYNNPVSSSQVTFAVASGGGSVTGATPFTTSSGIATVGSWKLGANPGTNTLTATVSGIAPVTFTATATTAPVTLTLPAVDPTQYNITAFYVVPPTARQQLAVERAIARWQRVIRGDIANVTGSIPANSCGENTPAISGTFDDLVIYVDFSPIDGVGKILGQAGPCFIRQPGNLPIVGALDLDAADLAAMETDGTIDDVVLHEIGHILGFGTIWDAQGLLLNASTDSVRFSGAGAGQAFTDLGGVTFPGKPVPVENCVGIVGCGAGTQDSHWRELVMGRELMTGYIGSSGTNPLSRITIQSLADIGYTVDITAADSYSVSASLRASDSPERELIESKPTWAMRTIRTK